MHWDSTPRDFESWSKVTSRSERFDPALWCVVRAGRRDRRRDDLHRRHVRRRLRPRRSSPVARGAGRAWARRSSATSFGRFWERGERSVGLGVDAASDTGAFRLYERAGMTPALGWVMYEKALRPPGRPALERRASAPA